MKLSLNNIKNKKLIIGIGAIVVIGALYVMFKTPSLTKNEELLCKLLKLENQYKKNPKFIKCVLDIVSDKFSDELRIIEDFKKGNKADAAFGGLEIYLNGNTKAKIFHASKDAYSQCKKYK